MNQTLIELILITLYISLLVTVAGVIFSRHNLLVMILFADLILLNIALIACFSTIHLYFYSFYIFVLALIAVAACETAIALAITVSVYEKQSTIDNLYMSMEDVRGF